MPVFVDTNVLVYARDATEPDKRRRASEWLHSLWRSRSGRLSLQVLQEYYATVTRKLTPGLSAREARADIRDLMAWRPVPIDALALEGGWDVEDRFGLSFWDALIVSAARLAGCERLLTEDLQSGRAFDGVTVVDPFTSAPP